MTLSRLAILTPQKSAVSETFITAHLERLPAKVWHIHGQPFPAFFGDGMPLSGPWHARGLRIAGRLMGWDAGRRFDRALGYFLRKHGIQLVLAEYGTTGIQAMNACRNERIPLVVHFHGHDVYSQYTLVHVRDRYPDLFSCASAIVAVSRDMVRALYELGAPHEKVVLNPYGIDTKMFGGGHPEQAPPVFLAVGRFVDKKGPLLTLLAFRSLLTRIPDARLFMVGDGPLLEACRQVTRSLDLAANVSFFGSCSHGEVARMMREVRAFIQHSLRTGYGDSEGTPVAILEASASGLPVIATRHAGICDVVVDGETGFLVEEGSLDEMANRMHRVATEPVLAGKLGAAARERVIEHFSMQKAINGLHAILESALVREQGR